jgi:hypothetical protein
MTVADFDFASRVSLAPKRTADWLEDAQLVAMFDHACRELQDTTSPSDEQLARMKRYEIAIISTPSSDPEILVRQELASIHRLAGVAGLVDDAELEAITNMMTVRAASKWRARLSAAAWRRLTPALDWYAGELLPETTLA